MQLHINKPRLYDVTVIARDGSLRWSKFNNIELLTVRRHIMRKKREWKCSVLIRIVHHRHINHREYF